MRVAQKAETFFDEHVEDYDTKHYTGGGRNFMTVRQERVLEFVNAIGISDGALALDAGCGPGSLMSALAQRGLRVCGLDAAAGMLRRARSRLQEVDSAFTTPLHQGSIEQLPYQSGVFDLVCSTGVIEYLASDARALAELYRVLRPGGSLIIAVTNFWSPANYLETLIEFAKRRRSMRVPLNALLHRLGHRPVLPRHFCVRRHRPAAFRRSIKAIGFHLEEEIYFHFLPWPRPFDACCPS